MSSTMDSGARMVLEGMARRLSDTLDQIAELQEAAKLIKAEAKSDGYDMKAFGQVVKEMRRGAEYQASQLELELVLDTYRRALDLPTDLEVAQTRARADAGSLPEADGDEDAQPYRRRQRETVQ